MLRQHSTMHRGLDMRGPEGPIVAGRYVGQRLPRKEDARLLTGRGTFVDDVVIAGMAQVAFVRSQIARGKIKSIDVSFARTTPGVRAVLVAEDLGRFGVSLYNMHMAEGPPGVKPLPSNYVSHVGDPIAMVIADDRYIAEDAAGMVRVYYEEEDPVITIGDAQSGALVRPGTDTNVVAAAELPENPALAQAFAAAAHVVEHSIVHQRVSQSPMETRGVVSLPTGPDELTVYLVCQSHQVAARIFALSFRLDFRLDSANIRVIAKDVGGGFGLKAQPWREEGAVVAASMVLKRPLKWIEDRFEALTCGYPACEQECTVRLAFDADVELLAVDVDYASNNGAYPMQPDANMGAMMFYSGPYKFPLFGYKGRGYYTNTIGLGGYRGPWAMEALSRETAFDVAAKQIGIDPIELRRRNLVSAADQPMVSASGLQLYDITPIECLDQLLKLVDVEAFRAEQGAARAEGRYLGLGVTTYVEPTASIGVDPLWSDIAHIRIEPTGKVIASLSTHSQGQGTETTMAQVIAERLGVLLEDVMIYQEDSSRSGFGPGAAGSRQAVIPASAAMKAADILVDKLKRIAAHAFNANADEIRIEAGFVHLGPEDQKRSVREIAELAYGGPFRLPADMEIGLDAQYRYTPPDFMTFASAAHACIVEVDIETGFVKIKRWVCSEDCGVMINPAIVEGQIAGVLTQGIGLVLLEELPFDERGNITAATYKDYLVPNIADIPEFEFTHIITPSKAETGARGVGEGGMIIGPPTLINAIMDALEPFGVGRGDEPLKLPLTPSRLLSMVANAPHQPLAQP
jgi:carbon-monoxide dehydrogenase large subunit